MERCTDCNERPPYCDYCLSRREHTLTGSACVLGMRWGASLRRITDRPFLDYDDPDAEKLRAYCRRRVAELANQDARLTESLARAFAGEAKREYETPLAERCEAATLRAAQWKRGT